MGEGEKRDRESVDRVYIFVCKGDTCSQKGGVERLRVTLRQLARELPAQKVKIAYTSCLGMCGEGPNVLVCGGGTAHHRCGDAAAGGVIEDARGILEGRGDP